MKKSFFGIKFDPNSQPGILGRYQKGPDVPGQITGSSEEPVNLGVKISQLDSAMPVSKFWNSGQVDKCLPSRIFRKRGIKP